MKKASEIGFGVEIECNIPDEMSASFPAGGYHRGTQIPVLPEGWNGQSDCSVQAQAGYRSIEIVSPILKGEAGLVQLVEVVDFLDSINARTNNTCGLHVHVSCDFLTQPQRARLVKVFRYFEDAFFSLNGDTASTRKSSHYCKPAARWDGTRYQSLNLQHMDHGHIEIRVWSGTMAAEQIVSAIYMAVAIVSRVTDEQIIKTSGLEEEKHTKTMARFIQECVRGDTMIVPDLDPADIFLNMMKQAKQAF
jgi:hypothetical protein